MRHLRHRCSFRRHARGQAILEMALAIGVLFAVILGAVDAIQIMMTRYTVAQAVRAAAHQAALIGGPDGANGALTTRADASRATGTIAETARLILASGMATDPGHATITVTCAQQPCRRYSAITVRIRYQDALWAPGPGFADVHADVSSTRASEKDGQ